VHSHTGDRSGRDLSGHGRKLTEQGALTNWGPQRERLVITQKESDPARHTHSLETAEGETCQDMEGKRPSEMHSQSGDRRGRDLSGDGKKLTEQGALTNWGPQREGLVRTRKEATKQGTLTNWRPQREGLVRTRKESDQARRTHSLETAEGGTCQDMKGSDRARHAHILETAEGGTCQDTERN